MSSIFSRAYSCICMPVACMESSYIFEVSLNIYGGFCPRWHHRKGCCREPEAAVVATINQSVDRWWQLFINQSIRGCNYLSISRSVVATMYQSFDRWWQLFINQSISGSNYLSISRFTRIYQDPSMKILSRMAIGRGKKHTLINTPSRSSSDDQASS